MRPAATKGPADFPSRVPVQVGYTLAVKIRAVEIAACVALATSSLGSTACMKWSDCRSVESSTKCTPAAPPKQSSDGGAGGDSGAGGADPGGGGEGGEGAAGGSPGTGGSGGGNGGSPGAFSIALEHRGTPTSSQRRAFDRAAARWSELITADLPDIERVPAGECLPDAEDGVKDIDDVLIYALIEEIDGPGKVLGMAGPCMVRDSGPADLTVVGVMMFDKDDLEALEEDGDLETTILHEMAHVLGFGIFWSDLLHDPSLEDPGADTYFSGSRARALFETVGGRPYDGNKVPVENEFLAEGSADSHWRESVFDNELMTPFIGGERKGNPLSSVTLASLDDLGYAVDLGKAEAYELPDPNAPPVAGADRAKRRFLNEVLLRPRFGIAPGGALRRLATP